MEADASMVFTVTRSGDLSQSISLGYATQNGTAKAGKDYRATSGTLTFAANKSSATIRVPIINNDQFEPSKTFSIRLSSIPSFSTDYLVLAPAVAAPYLDHGVASGDLNGDGKADLAGAVFSTNHVSVALNTTPSGVQKPSFASPKDLTLSGKGPVGLAIADLNADGKLDLAVANCGPSGSYEGIGVSVLLNTTPPKASTASFAASQQFAAGVAYSIQAADLNGDGKPDLVVGDLESSTISVLLNTTEPGAGQASFTTTSIKTNAGSQSLAITDLNGDERPDIVVAEANHLTVLLNNTAPGSATPEFALGQPIALAGVSVIPDVAAGDFNGDGRPDLAAATWDANTVVVLLNTTPAGADAVTFAPAKAFTAGSLTVGVAVADLDSDGRLDLAVSDASSAALSVLLNATPADATVPQFGGRKDVALGSSPRRVIAGDFNGDGQPDLATYLYCNHIAVLANLSPRLTDGEALGTIINDDPLTLQGEAADDRFLLRLDPTGTNLAIWQNAPIAQDPTFLVPLANGSALAIAGGGGNDALVLDCSNGQPLASSALSIQVGSLSLQVQNGNSVLRTNGLSIAPDATFDLADNDLIVTATPQSKDQALATLATCIQSARGMGGKWTGSGLTSTAAKLNKQTGLAVLLNEKDTKPILTTFNGQTVGTDDILVKYTWNGDVNLDGVVDAADYFLVDSGFITQAGQYRNGDLNLDGVVDAADYFLIDSAFIAQTSVLAASDSLPQIADVKHAP